MTATPRHGLPLLAAGQAQKELTHNEALLAIDRRLQTAVESRTLATSPLDPGPGAMYIVAAGSDGAWAGRDGMLASWDGFGWHFTMTEPGWLVWIADEAIFAVFNEGWSTSWPASGLLVAGREVFRMPPVVVAAPTGGAVVDVECRTAVATLLSALRNQGIVL
jgi:hypothetical protein